MAAASTKLDYMVLRTNPPISVFKVEEESTSAQLMEEERENFAREKEELTQKLQDSAR